ncbi:hypothetical protein C8R44DRAFT_735933 [Mycena epipterygia]|nr:hypothetical protein C8R44DRAFT_735933 [Mycena epipterygia]
MSRVLDDATPPPLLLARTSDGGLGSESVGIESERPRRGAARQERDEEGSEPPLRMDVDLEPPEALKARNRLLVGRRARGGETSGQRGRSGRKREIGTKEGDRAWWGTLAGARGTRGAAGRQWDVGGTAAKQGEHRKGRGCKHEHGDMSSSGWNWWPHGQLRHKDLPRMHLAPTTQVVTSGATCVGRNAGIHGIASYLAVLGIRGSANEDECRPRPSGAV